MVEGEEAHATVVQTFAFLRTCLAKGSLVPQQHEEKAIAGAEGCGDPEAQLEDLIDTRTCIALVIYLGVLIVAIVVACLLIVTRGFWAGDVVLCCIIALYELSVLQATAPRKLCVMQKMVAGEPPTRIPFLHSSSCWRSSDGETQHKLRQLPGGSCISLCRGLWGSGTPTPHLAGLSWSLLLKP
ncbi:unnamed protein product [Symbiodinium natans]|uniref:Uncharacterized protein n=1 Tax=Symbiodinium natans TaxID=878477 RepID=A0A812HYJ5_9DINO|nr:unnamed protein product [Symbiodinium natans]